MRYNLQQYRQFDAAYKCRTLGQYGHYLTRRKKGIHNIELYALNNFFVEVWFDVTNQWAWQNVMIVCFKHTEFLRPYLGQINIDKVNNTSI